MQLIEVPAKTGYVWFRQGIWLFRKNPLAFLAMFLAYIVVMTLIAAVPVIGPVLRFAFIPGAAVGFMAACRDTIAGKPVFPTVLIEGFRAYGGTVAQRLLVLGLLYVAAVSVMFGASALADGGVMLRMVFGTGEVTEKMVMESNQSPAALIAFLIYVPVVVLFWFSPILCAWHNVPPMKAMFFSIVSCWRNRGAFIVYWALWFALFVAVLFSLFAVLVTLGADVITFAFVLVPAFFFLFTMFYCSFYATYRGCFGFPPAETPDLPAQPQA